jgi:hypothetical protein
MRAVTALLLSLTLWAAADDDPVEVLMRVRDRVLAHAQRIPNHTCLETITRDWYDYVGVPAPKSCDALLGRRHRAGVGTLIRLATTDRVRLDVGLAETEEMYSWPGAKRFEDREIDEFVPPGAMGTGPFAAALLSIFELRDPKFVFENDVTVNGRRLMEYSFRVAEDQSHYKVKAGDQWLISGYTGTMLVDPRTADLVELTVRTEELPAASHLCEVDSTLAYGMVRMRGEDYLVPTLTRQRFIEQDGSEAENAITFSACRDFRGDSEVSFGAGPETAAGKAQAVANLPPDLPAGLPVTVELTSTIEVDQAAAGDRIEGRLAAPVRDARRKILLPEGTALQGRLMQVETKYGRPPVRLSEAIVALRWGSMEVNGARTPFFIAPDRRKPAAFELRGQEPRYAVFHFSGEHVVVKSGLESQWLTQRHD